jgi:GAF domain-containing protein
MSSEATSLERLYRSAAALAGALSQGEVASAIFDNVVAGLGAVSVGLWLLQDGSTITMVSGAGQEEGLVESVDAMALDADLPAAQVMRTLKPVSYSDHQERSRRWPVLAPLEGRGPPAAVVLPLVARFPLGALSIGFGTERRFSEEDLSLFAALAEQCATALDRATLYEAEREARDSLEYLFEATRVMTSTQDPREVVARMAEMAVPRLGDVCAVYVPRAQHLVVAALALDGPPELAEQLRAAPPLPVAADVPAAISYRTGLAVLEAPLEADGQDRVDPGAVLRRAGLGPLSSTAAVPLVSGGRIIGVMAVGYGRSGRSHRQADISTLRSLAGRVAVCMDNARRYTEQREAARLLSTALLPAGFPALAGYHFDAHYVPASGDVCGDWYEADTLPDGGLLVGIGDAAGHGVEAASLMAELRHGARALAAVEEDPGAILGHLARRLSQGSDSYATACYLNIDPASGAAVWASAGHPPALHITQGRVEVLDRPIGPPLGSPVAGAYPKSSLSIAPGDLLLLYTDGLIERRGGDLSLQLDELVEAVSALAARGAPAEDLAGTLRNQMCDDLEDDCCFLLVQREA